MNKRLLRRAALGLGWAILTLLFFVIFISHDISKYYSAVSGTVTGKDCQDHGQVMYSFDAEGQNYSGVHGVGWCSSTVIGHSVKIYYNILDRDENTPNDPRYEMNNRTIFTAISGGFLAAVAMWLVSKRWRFGRS